jgi:hypothetical protein
MSVCQGLENPTNDSKYTDNDCFFSTVSTRNLVTAPWPTFPGSVPPVTAERSSRKLLFTRNIFPLPLLGLLALEKVFCEEGPQEKGGNRTIYQAEGDIWLINWAAAGHQQFPQG